jgi:hypothetical protein
MAVDGQCFLPGSARSAAPSGIDRQLPSTPDTPRGRSFQLRTRPRWEPDAYECIGSETREVLERRPAAVVAVKLVYKKFARKDRERGGETEVLVGETVELPIERGSAGPGFLADSIVRRWQDQTSRNFMNHRMSSFLSDQRCLVAP